MTYNRCDEKRKGKNLKVFKFVEVYLPEEYIESLRNELNSLGILTFEGYDHVVSYSTVKEYWRPLQESTAFSGAKGVISFGTECKLEFRCLYKNIEEFKNIIRGIQPYEEPVINVIPMLN